MFHIMSYNQISGHMSGAFDDIDQLFLKSGAFSYGDVYWTPYVSEAKGFNTNEHAWAFVESIWGENFSKDCFLVVESRSDQSDRDEQAKKWAEKRRAFRRGLAQSVGFGGRVAADTLMRLAENAWDNGMRGPEQWIVEIMTKKDG